MAQQRRAGRVISRKQISSIDTRETHMDMHAAAGEIGIGLGHEGHELAVLGGDTAQQTLE